MPPKKNISSKNVPTYKHLSSRDQILLRPGQHIGNTSSITDVKSILVVDDDGKIKIVERDVTFTPALVHIFYEVLSNAQDNHFRSIGTSVPLKMIKVTVNENSISVWNDGMHIPVQIHKWLKDEENLGEMYDPELIFGYLNSSSNYDDDENVRTGAGLHGVGVKLTNIFSSLFTVECHDPINQKKFIQTYSNNLEHRTKPKITTLKKGKGYTKITYLFDKSRFEGDGYDETFYSIIKKMCLDCSLVTGVKVSFNDDIFYVKNLIEYSYFYLDENVNRIEFKSKDSQIVVCENDEKTFRHTTFVNGIHVPKGGIHLNEWCKAIFKPLLERIQRKFKELKITQKTLQDHFCIFVVCNLENPTFESQTKNTLISPKPKVDVPTSKITSIMKWKFMEDLEEMIRIQSMKELKKTDGKNNESLRGYKVDDANKAKSNDYKERLKCTLYITEGDSAATFVEAGMDVIKGGSDYNGIMPVRGKVLNVRDATADKINNNNEITTLKKVLRLQHGLDYSNEKNFQNLRYGKIKLLTDADEDGHHIKGLIMNFFFCFYPSLVQRGYIMSLQLPIVKITLSPSKNIIDFYYLRDFKKWHENNQNTKFTARYYKGLGSNDDSEVIEVFKNSKEIIYPCDDNAIEIMDMVFSKIRADDRKKWLEEYNDEKEESESESEEDIKSVTISDFINKDLRGFSIYDNKRSIASMVDGLKTVQRKILWTSLHHLSATSISKVTTFASDVVKYSQYHHGETSLLDAIIGMAQTFVGSNNITFFSEGGQFGSRKKGGEDSAAARYIHTKLLNITRLLFRKEDDPILTHVQDEGNFIEPKYFVPILPLLLINGCVGIGTGYSTKIPSYNPKDLAEWLKVWIHNETCEDKKEYPDLIPWHRGFKGTVEKNDNRISFTGIIAKGSKKNTYIISELPIGTWTDNYVEKLESFVESRLITDFDKDKSKHNIKFTIYSTKELNADNMKLKSYVKLENLTAFKSSGGIRQYPSIDILLKSWCSVRYLFYKKRKKFTLSVLKEKLQEQQSKSKFISAVLKNVTLLKQKEDELFSYFEKNNYYKKNGEYRYLTDILVRNFTQDKYEVLMKQIEETKKEIQYIFKTPCHEMWLVEIDEFLKEYDKYIKN